MRFSDKPVEVSCCSFSTDRRELRTDTLASIDLAVQHSLLVENAEGRTDRNSQVIHYQYQIHPMLAPTFELPVVRGGAASLTAAELDSLFQEDEREFNRVKNVRLSRMNAPFRASRRRRHGDLHREGDPRLIDE
jgi:hypothetical protein